MRSPPFFLTVKSSLLITCDLFVTYDFGENVSARKVSPEIEGMTRGEVEKSGEKKTGFGVVLLTALNDVSLTVSFRTFEFDMSVISKTLNIYCRY